MVTGSDIANFLRSDPNISKLNFQFGSFKVYPSAYRVDVADAFDKGAIKIREEKLPAGVGCAYDMAYDCLSVRVGFTAGIPDDQSYLVHEATHAHFDIQKTGSVSRDDLEGAAYLAEAIWREANGLGPFSSDAVRIEAHRVAKTMLTGLYVVPAADVAALQHAVATNAHYAKMPAVYPSNGFERDLIRNVLR